MKLSGSSSDFLVPSSSLASAYKPFLVRDRRNARFRIEKMNARPASTGSVPVEEISDTDSNPDEELPEYYQPIAAAEDDEGDESETEQGFALVSSNTTNGYAEEAERAISSIHIDDSSEDEEGLTAAVVSDSEILRAFSEDESRRTAPLPAETAMRVMEAMRGVSFTGAAPDWTGQVPEDQWIHQLRRIREFSST